MVSQIEKLSALVAEKSVLESKFEQVEIHLKEEVILFGQHFEYLLGH